MARRSRPSPSRYDYDSPPGRSETPSSSPFNAKSLAVLGGVFILGIGIGIAFSSTANFSPENVASREVIDRAAPNPELCAQFGASAIAVDMRMFVTFNPFNAYVAQPTLQPACVLRSNNWTILEQRDLVSSQDVRECKNRMNTFGFIGALESSPEVDCVYQNDAAKNLFLEPGMEGLPETERF
ncbi:DUF3172 domain-containing protein [Prochlorothrix hollandica]|uniref:DUF3172 domain-containing protein n=1 Tax=Prochlorothrix hollandica TaxID=1223 RepID=UPI000349BCEB|nr:DUF3172 domain-containing protein [Prochlorothrix hollandica]